MTSATISDSFEINLMRIKNIYFEKSCQLAKFFHFLARKVFWCDLKVRKCENFQKILHMSNSQKIYHDTKFHIDSTTDRFRITYELRSNYNRHHGYYE